MSKLPSRAAPIDGHGRILYPFIFSPLLAAESQSPFVFVLIGLRIRKICAMEFTDACMMSIRVCSTAVYRSKHRGNQIKDSNTKTLLSQNKTYIFQDEPGRNGSIR
jgi:hypothetical protein